LTEQQGVSAGNELRISAAVVVFPGTNCELDVVWALGMAGIDAELVFHTESPPDNFDLYVIPGGFSYGDYLRPGAVARFSPVMSTVRAAATFGKPVVGICNGFQILCEAGMLPGALQKNRGLRFLCSPVHLRVENANSPITCGLEEGKVLENIPINHFEGNFTASPDVLDELERCGQIQLRYCGPKGDVDDRFNPNGSMKSIAAVSSRSGNVTGLMPHPERAAEEILGSADGAEIIRSMALFARRVRDSDMRATSAPTKAG
jgi:phosphoribosylformylglycinamidine synthase I